MAMYENSKQGHCLYGVSVGVFSRSRIVSNTLEAFRCTPTTIDMVHYADVYDILRKHLTKIVVLLMLGLRWIHLR